MRVGFRVVSMLFFGALSLSRADNPGRPDNSTYSYVPPEDIHDGWPVSSIAKVNLDGALVTNLFDRIIDNTYKNIPSVVVVKDGLLVIEEYFPRQEALGSRQRALKRVSPLQLYSATKSVNSILIGIATDQGLIHSVDEPISKFLPEYDDVFKAAEKARLSLKDFLTMTAGLSWDEWTYPYSDPRNDALQAMLSPHPIRYLLERPVNAAPGAKFTYNTGISIALGQILFKASGLRADKFAERYLFEPLDITDYYWAKVPDDLIETGGGLFLRPRDMAKIGYLFLNGGAWHGKQIVGKKWIEASTKNYIGSTKFPSWLEAANGYGYQWWLGTLRAGAREVSYYGARGRGGQFILVFPELQMVTVFTGLNDNLLMNQPLDMLQRYLLPAALPQTAQSEPK